MRQRWHIFGACLLGLTAVAVARTPSTLEDLYGGVLRGWSNNPMYGFTAFVDTELRVEVRCSTDPSCESDATLSLDVQCPSSGNLSPGLFETILAIGNDGFAWTTAVDYDVFSGELQVVSAYGGSLILTGTGIGFTDPGEPLPGDGTYYVVRESAEYCNAAGAWSSGGPAESPAREPALP